MPAPRHLYIVTGASRGLGLAMASQLLQRGHHLLCVSRHTQPDLDTAARQTGAVLEQWSADLADASGTAERLRAWLHDVSRGPFASATLINNAGSIPALVPLRDSAPSDLAHALRVGLEAPMQLCAAFLGATRDWQVPRKVLNVSSGLGRRAMASQAGYCAAKAGMDHFTRCMALDEARLPQGAKVCSLAPGVIDTDMQTQLRHAQAAQFPDQDRFARLHTDGQLSSPHDAARQVLAYLARPDYGAQPVADVRD